MNAPLVRRFCVLAALVVLSGHAGAQDFELTVPATAADPSLGAAMRDLAERMLPVYEDPDPERYLANLSALQLVAGSDEAANDTRKTLRDRRTDTDVGPRDGQAVLFDLYARARAEEAHGGVSFAQAFAQAFRDTVPQLSDRDAYAVTDWRVTPTAFQQAMQDGLDHLRPKRSITPNEAIDLIWGYLLLDAYRRLDPLLDTLAREDDGRRYEIEDDLRIETSAGVLHARLVRPKREAKLPALLEFTIYTARNDAARASAAHGYAGIIAYTRGKNPLGEDERRRITPFEHDGEDARAVIRWIAAQPWSDGRVGMHGSGYSGFAAWSAARRAPSALKAIATSNPMAPGIDFPMERGVFRNTAYQWAATHARSGVKAGDDADRDAAWRALDEAWYRSGKRYRELDRLSGNPLSIPNSIFRRWLNHPSYDRYWQKLIPFGKQFAEIHIPVLTSTGYYAEGEVGALYYFAEHLRHRRDARHTLVIGPWDEGVMQSPPPRFVRGYAFDPAARVDVRELQYHWFDQVLKGAGRPALLKDRVNWQAMGTDEWRHAPSPDAVSNGMLRYYLEGSAVHRLVPARGEKGPPPTLTVRFADRSDSGRNRFDRIVSGTAGVEDGAIFVSDPLPQPVEIAGLLSGRLDFKLNKLDVDLNLTVYEVLPTGEYLRLSDPYEFRASYARDRAHRRLLEADKRQQLAFESEQLMGRRTQAGSRLALVLGVNQRADRETNYGTGKDVSDESVADAAAPLKIEWYSGSYIDVPIRK